MKKLGLLVMPLMALSFLTNCNKTSDSLENYSWKQISEISKSGKAGEKFKVGDTKTVKINGLDHKVRIIDFNHDKNTDGNLLGITFEFADLISDKDGAVHVTWNDGGAEVHTANYCFINSTINNFLNDENNNNSVINMFPNDLKEVIKPVDKLVGINEKKDPKVENYETKSFITKLFPLAKSEITNASYTTPGEGTLYKYYEGHSDEYKLEDEIYRIKKPIGGDDKYNCFYWLRSPVVASGQGDTYVFAAAVSFKGVMVRKIVYHQTEEAEKEKGIAPAFCI